MGYERIRVQTDDLRHLKQDVAAKDLHASGKSFVSIAAESRVGHRTIAKWGEVDSRSSNAPDHAVIPIVRLSTATGTASLVGTLSGA